MSYRGPRKIVIIGGGIAGLAAADAITEALTRCEGPLPEGIEITIIEGERALGGRAASWPVDEVRELHPHAPFRVDVPHGIHFVWGCYTHFIRLCERAGVKLAPSRGTPTYCAWMAPPDLRGGDSAPAAIVAVHVCDPREPEAAWDPRARAILRAYRRSSAMTGLLERFFFGAFNVEIKLEDYLSYLDILFADAQLSPELRWRIFMSGVFASLARLPETSPVLRDILSGRRPTDVDIGELMGPMFFDFVVPSLKRAQRTIVDAGLDAEQRGEAPRRSNTRAEPGTLGAVAAFFALVARDATATLARVASYHPKRSGYLKNILKAAFSSPFALDVATAIRDAQFGLRNHPGAILRTFDGDDSRRAFDAVREMIAARIDGERIGGGFRRAWVKRIEVDAGGVTRVELTDRVSKPPSPVPTVRPAKPGETTAVIDADVVVSTVLPQCLVTLLPEPDATAAELHRSLRSLGRFMNETVNLQLFFPEKHALAFPPMPEGSRETPPFSISNIEGPFTIVIDLERAWSADAFARIALDRKTSDAPFRGTAWELVGAYADVFTFDEHAHPGRYQWPLAAQQKLARLLHDPDDFVPGTLDTRAWVHDIGAPGRLPPPMFGEVKPERAAEYLRRWHDEASPLIAANAMRQLAAMPKLADRTRRFLLHESDCVEARAPSPVKFTVVRNCQAENRFFSAEPGLFPLRPHARFETAIRGLFVAGDWTRNGLNLQSMEAAVVSGVQAAHAVIERMRAGGIAEIEPPFLSPDILPRGAWDTGL